MTEANMENGVHCNPCTFFHWASDQVQSVIDNRYGWLFSGDNLKRSERKHRHLMSILRPRIDPNSADTVFKRVLYSIYSIHRDITSTRSYVLCFDAVMPFIKALISALAITFLIAWQALDGPADPNTVIAGSYRYAFPIVLGLSLPIHLYMQHRDFLLNIIYDIGSKFLLPFDYLARILNFMTHLLVDAAIIFTTITMFSDSLNGIVYQKTGLDGGIAEWFPTRFLYALLALFTGFRHLNAFTWHYAQKPSLIIWFEKFLDRINLTNFYNLKIHTYISRIFEFFARGIFNMAIFHFLGTAIFLAIEKIFGDDPLTSENYYILLYGSQLPTLGASFLASLILTSITSALDANLKKLFCWQLPSLVSYVRHMLSMQLKNSINVAAALAVVAINAFFIVLYYDKKVISGTDLMINGIVSGALFGLSLLCVIPLILFKKYYDIASQYERVNFAGSVEKEVDGETYYIALSALNDFEKIEKWRKGNIPSYDPFKYPLSTRLVLDAYIKTRLADEESDERKILEENKGFARRKKMKAYGFLAETASQSGNSSGEEPSNFDSFSTDIDNFNIPTTRGQSENAFANLDNLDGPVKADDSDQATFNTVRFDK